MMCTFGCLHYRLRAEKKIKLYVSSLSNTPCCMLLLISKICNIPKDRLANMGKGVTGWKFGVCQQTEFLSYP